MLDSCRAESLCVQVSEISTCHLEFRHHGQRNVATGPHCPKQALPCHKTDFIPLYISMIDISINDSTRGQPSLAIVFQKARLSGEQAPLKLVWVWYNAACAEAVAGHTKAAKGYLQKAIDLGYTDIATMTTDKDLKSLRKNPRFIALLAEVKERAALPPPSK